MGGKSRDGVTIVVAGPAGDLGARIVNALIAQHAPVRRLVRQHATRASMPEVETAIVDFADPASLVKACVGAACVVSALNGTDPVILGAQGRLLDAAVAAGVPRFMPSDYSFDYTRTRPGDNRNMDLRRAFMERVDRAPIRATSILNGAFADLLTGGAPIVLHSIRRVLYWGRADQPFDFTTKNDVARYTALAALNADTPRFLRIAGDVASPSRLAAIMTQISGQRFGLLRAGGIGRLGTIIRVARALTPHSDTPFPVWQGMQYLRDMSTGRGKLDPLDNARFGDLLWSSAEDVLRVA